MALIVLLLLLFPETHLKLITSPTELIHQTTKEALKKLYQGIKETELLEILTEKRMKRETTLFPLVTI